MNRLHTIAAAITAAAGLAAAGQAFAADTPETLCKGGELVSLRVNTLKSAEKAAAYDKAAKDHIGWYRSKGYKDNQLMVGPVLVRNPDGSWSNSPTERVSAHVNPPGVPRDKQDDAWSAYVSEYRDSSDVSVEKFACLREVK